MRQKVHELAKRKTLAAVAVTALSFFVRLGLTPLLGVPVPDAHDEFSFLLAADTFAHHRLSNPTHPLWVHFESFHIIEQPTYMSMYPPAQGMVLALGQLLGRPWLGQLLITALMCGAICWMLQGWVPAEWALLGAILAVLRLGIFGYWMNGYWCASIAALGGALVWGAWPRLQRRPNISDSLWMALGLVILANSRPYEGLIVALPIAIAFMIWMFRAFRPRGIFTHVLVPLALVLAFAAAGMAYYNQRVDGSPFVMGYEINRAQYSRAAYFIWQGPRPEPVYRHEVMRNFYDREFAYYQENRTVAGYLRHAAVNISWFWRLMVGPAFTIPLFALPWAILDRRMRLPFTAMAIFIFGLAVETWFRPHYFAPATALFYLIVIQCMRHLRLWRHENRTGAALVAAVPMICCGMVVLRLAALLTHAQIEPVYPRGNLARAEISRQLEDLPGKQLVIVHYSPDHISDHEWVYDRADIDASKVVWARDMGEKENRELLDYYPNRTVWIVEPDQSPPGLFKFRPALH